MKKKLIKAEIDHAHEDRWDELYAMAQRFACGNRVKKKPTLMERLMQIEIDAPEDFAARFADLIQ
jgi:hypothetical protein